MHDGCGAENQPRLPWAESSVFGGQVHAAAGSEERRIDPTSGGATTGVAVVLSAMVRQMKRNFCRIEELWVAKSGI